MQDESIIEKITRRRRTGRKPRAEIPPLPTLAEVERKHIEAVLEATDGNMTHASEVLGIDRRTMYRLLDCHSRGTDRIVGLRRRGEAEAR